MGEGNDEFGLAKYFCSYLLMICKCRKILRHGASGFTLSPKEDVLRICIALKNPSPRLGFIPQTLGQMTGMLTITPPSRQPMIQPTSYVRH
jgi:hypothetical protein